MVKKLVVDLNIDMTQSTCEKPGHKKITPEMRKAVEDFYLRDDISRQAPGRRDSQKIAGKTSKASYVHHNKRGIRNLH